jgi:hypothetical protein
VNRLPNQIKIITQEELMIKLILAEVIALRRLARLEKDLIPIGIKRKIIIIRSKESLLKSSMTVQWEASLKGIQLLIEIEISTMRKEMLAIDKIVTATPTVAVFRTVKMILTQLITTKFKLTSRDEIKIFY